MARLNSLDVQVLAAIGAGAATMAELRDAIPAAGGAQVRASLQKMRWQGRVLLDGYRLSGVAPIEATTPPSAPTACAVDAPVIAAPPYPALDDLRPEAERPLPAGFSGAEVKPKFRSWVEDYKRPSEFIDHDALRSQRAIRRNMKAAAAIAKGNPLSPHAKLAAAAARDAAETAKRLADPIEPAKMFLQRRMPVYAAVIAGGPAGHFIVGRKTVTPAELIELAITKGWSPEVSQ